MKCQSHDIKHFYTFSAELSLVILEVVSETTLKYCLGCWLATNEHTFLTRLFLVSLCSLTGLCFTAQPHSVLYCYLFWPAFISIQGTGSALET